MHVQCPECKCRLWFFGGDQYPPKYMCGDCGKFFDAVPAEGGGWKPRVKKEGDNGFKL